MTFKVLIKKYFSLILVVLLALLFFLATASFNYYSQSRNYVKWSSPDETANYFFAKNFSQTRQLAVFSQADLIGQGLVIPRSVRSDQGWLKPVSFLGIILIYGQLAALLGSAVIPFLTPWFAAWGLILFYLIIKRLFSERVALWSAFLLASFPVYIYYTVRSMFHNVLFIVLLLAGLYFSLLAWGPKTIKLKTKFLTWSLPARQWWELLAIFIGGLFTGLAIITRTSELLWLLPVLIIIWLFYARRLGLTKPILFISAIVLAMLPVAYYNQIIYGIFWHGGYPAMNSSLNNIALSSGGIIKSTWTGQFNYYRQYFQQIFINVFYFGFNFKQSLVMAGHYIFRMFPFIFYGGFLGFVFLIEKNYRHFQKKYLVYSISYLVLSAILILYYGSWKFNDNPNIHQFTIGNSYTRYWLPIYLGLFPLVALALIRLSRAISFSKLYKSVRMKKIISTALQVLFILIIASSSIIFVLYGSDEGLGYLYYHDQIEKITTQQVWSLTAPNSIIITRYNDKYFWPERQVIVGTLPNRQIQLTATKLLKYYPVYYYNFYLNQATVNYLNNRKLKPYNLRLKLIRKLNLRFGLYQLELKNKF